MMYAARMRRGQTSPVTVVTSSVIVFLLLTSYHVTHAQLDDTELAIEYEVIEESPGLSYVGNVATSAGLDRRFEDAVLRLIEFDFLNIGHDTNLFKLEKDSGVIRTSQPIDRDSRCPSSADCYIDLDVAIVKPVEHFQVISVRVNIIDENDQYPTFTPNSFTVQFSESESLGASVNLPIALDLDSPFNGVRGYRTTTVVPEFKLQEQVSPSGLIDLQLILDRRLDREEVDNYQVIIEAYDGGTPSKKGTLVVDIIVEDANDHSPRFANSSFEVTVPENFPLNKTFFHARASDPDYGDNGHVVYAFGPRTTSLYGMQFGINRNTGKISLLRPLDFETKEGFSLNVVASDLGPKSMATMATLNIKVQDVNDNKPQIMINTLNDKPFAEVMENSGPGKFTAHLSVIDSDNGRNGDVTCALDHPAFGLQNMKARNQYKLVTNLGLDREVAAVHLVRVACEDRGSPALTASATLSVHVLDENDHTPQFVKQAYFAIIDENNAPNFPITQINATDADAGENSRLTYEIVNLHHVSGYVRLNPDTGMVRAVKSLDFEQTERLAFAVVVRDHGDPPRSATVSVNVAVRDHNDEAPQFSDRHYSFSVRENQPLNTSVGKVTASDRDTEGYNRFEFSLSADQIHDYESFDIDTATGEIITRRVLNREVQDIYVLKVTAIDIDKPKLYSTASVTIYVDDENDNYPEIEYPTEQNSSFPISSKVKHGYNILKIVANDQDIGRNADLHYRIMEGNIDGLFAVNSSTGILMTDADLSDIVYKEYSLKVRVRDRGNPPKATSRHIRIIVDKAVAYVEGHGSGMVHKNNLTIIIAVAAVSGVIIVILIIAILCLKMMDRRRHLGKEYNCRQEEQKILNDLNVKALEANGNMCAKAHAQKGRKGKSGKAAAAATAAATAERGQPGGVPRADSRASIPGRATIQRNPSCHSNVPECHVVAMESAHHVTGSSFDPNIPFADEGNPQHSRHLEAHLMALLKQDQDAESASSAEMSTTDSGRGPSEEGEGKHGMHHPHESGYASAPHPRTAHGHYVNRLTHPNQPPPPSYPGPPGGDGQHHPHMSTFKDPRQSPKPDRTHGMSTFRPSPAPSPSSSHPPPPAYSPHGDNIDHGENANIKGSSGHGAHGHGSHSNPRADAWQHRMRKPDGSLREIQEEEDNTRVGDGREEPVDPKQLCEEIDKLFFKKGVIV